LLLLNFIVCVVWTPQAIDNSLTSDTIAS
jgi:hypothetical protein